MYVIKLALTLMKLILRIKCTIQLFIYHLRPLPSTALLSLITVLSSYLLFDCHISILLSGSCQMSHQMSNESWSVLGVAGESRLSTRIRWSVVLIAKFLPTLGFFLQPILNVNYFIIFIFFYVFDVITIGLLWWRFTFENKYGCYC